MPSPEDRLNEMLDTVLDDACTNEQRCEFSSLLDSDPRVTKRIAEQFYIHSLLIWHFRDSEGSLAALPGELKSSSSSAWPRNSQLFAKLLWLTPKTLQFAAVSAAFALAFSVLLIPY